MVDPTNPGWFALGAALGTDLRYDADGLAGTPPEEGEVKEQTIDVQPNVFRIKATTEAEVKSDGLVADKTSIREDGGEQDIELTVTLKAALKEDATVNLSIVDFDGDGDAERDVTYFVTGLASVTIKADSTSAKTSFKLKPVDNTSSNDPRIIRVRAIIPGSGEALEDITITDDDTLTGKITLSADPATIKEGRGSDGSYDQSDRRRRGLRRRPQTDLGLGYGRCDARCGLHRDPSFFDD